MNALSMNFTDYRRRLAAFLSERDSRPEVLGMDLTAALAESDEVRQRLEQDALAIERYWEGTRPAAAGERELDLALAHAAAGDPEAVHRLLRAGADPLAAHGNALSIACATGQSAIARMLLEAGADPGPLFGCGLNRLLANHPPEYQVCLTRLLLRCWLGDAERAYIARYPRVLWPEMRRLLWLYGRPSTDPAWQFTMARLPDGLAMFIQSTARMVAMPFMMFAYANGARHPHLQIHLIRDRSLQLRLRFLHTPGPDHVLADVAQPWPFEVFRDTVLRLYPTLHRALAPDEE